MTDFDRIEEHLRAGKGVFVCEKQSDLDRLNDLGCTAILANGHWPDVAGGKIIIVKGFGILGDRFADSITGTMDELGAESIVIDSDKIALAQDKSSLGVLITALFDGKAARRAETLAHFNNLASKAAIASAAPHKDEPERDLTYLDTLGDILPPPNTVEQRQSGPVEALALPERGLDTVGARLITKRGSDFTMRNIEWLWQDKIPLGKVSMIVGNPGLGKSQLTSSLAAVVTTGGKWPVTRDQAPQGNVIILSAEDDPEDTIIPRLTAAGADTSFIHIVESVKIPDAGSRGFDLAQDIERLILEMARIGNVRMVVIDPISAYMGKADSHNNTEVRAVLAPLTEAARAMGAAILLVSHLNKSSGQEALLRTQGSIGFVAACRAVWGVCKDKENPTRRLFMPLKANLSTDNTGLAYSVESHAINSVDPAIHTSRIMWENEVVTLSAEEVFGAHSEEKDDGGTMSAAKEWLRDLLLQGDLPSASVEMESRRAGIKWITCRRAKDAIGAKAIQGKGDHGQRVWMWSLPKTQSKSYANRDD